MFKNYLKTAVRNLWRYKGFAFINILSLTIGIVGCLVIALFVWDEKKYDKFLPDAEYIYRLYEQRNESNATSYFACVPPAFATFLKQQYPEVNATTRILMRSDKFLIENADKKGYEEKGMYVDSNFFHVFPVRFLNGNKYTALNEPKSLVISEDIANRYFGNENPVGKTLKINKDDFTVRAVFAKLPEHFHLRFQYMMPMSAAGLPKERMERWTWHQFFTYVKLNPGSNFELLQNKFQAYVKKGAFPTQEPSDASFLPFFQPLKDIHLKSADFVYDNAVRGNATYVRALSIIALFVLIIACFNFINLATARSFRRAKEIGVRKVIGAERRQLILQFMGETVLLAVLSTVIAAAATALVLPSLNSFTGKHISFNPFTYPLIIPVLLLAGLVVGILAGIYPALVLSGFQPIKVLKGLKITGNNSHSWLRETLVIVQLKD